MESTVGRGGGRRGTPWPWQRPASPPPSIQVKSSPKQHELSPSSIAAVPNLPSSSRSSYYYLTLQCSILTMLAGLALIIL